MKTWNIEYNGKQYGKVQGDNEEEALNCARMKVRQSEGFSEKYVNTAFLFVAEEVEQIDVMGNKKMPMNVWGKITLLLSVLYKNGNIPECSIYAIQGDPGYVINGMYAGETEEQITTFVWRMVACYEVNGYLFE